MIEVCILVPTADNAKVLFSVAHHEDFERELIALFSGFQMDSGLVSGQWLDAGKVYADDLRTYRVAVAGMIVDAAKIATMVSMAKTHYTQLAVYVRYLTVSEIV